MKHVRHFPMLEKCQAFFGSLFTPWRAKINNKSFCCNFFNIFFLFFFYYYNIRKCLSVCLCSSFSQPFLIRLGYHFLCVVWRLCALLSTVIVSILNTTEKERYWFSVSFSSTFLWLIKWTSEPSKITLKSILHMFCYKSGLKVWWNFEKFVWAANWNCK